MRFEFSRWQCQGWRTALVLLWHMAQGHLETDVYLDIFEGVWKLQVALKTRTTQPFLPLFGQRRCKDVQGALECRKVFTTFTSEAATEILFARWLAAQRLSKKRRSRSHCCWLFKTSRAEHAAVARRAIVFTSVFS